MANLNETMGKFANVAFKPFGLVNTVYDQIAGKDKKDKKKGALSTIAGGQMPGGVAGEIFK